MGTVILLCIALWVGAALWSTYAAPKIKQGREHLTVRSANRQDSRLRRRNDAHACPLCHQENEPAHSCHVEIRYIGRTVRREVERKRRNRRGRQRYSTYKVREEVRVYAGVIADRWGPVWTCKDEHTTTAQAKACATKHLRAWQVKLAATPTVAKPPPEKQPVPVRLRIADLPEPAWEEMKRAAGYRCAYCSEVSAVLQKEHKVPLSRGGANSAANIVPACPTCNYRKGVLTDSEFRDRLRAEKERGLSVPRQTVARQAPEFWRTDAPTLPPARTTRAPSSGGKSCSACKQALPLSAFGSNRSRPDGLHHTCRTCVNARNAAYKQNQPEAYAETRRNQQRKQREAAKQLGYVAASKRCRACRIEKPASEFHLDRSRPDGLQRRCRECIAMGRTEGNPDGTSEPAV